ncbi:hypothetical protein [Tepidanaerobacter syntrophicus]|uniref:hypothetical protein n=1 Tax=Tepidanaerobacter syntrophicus TaxID=224999 RepID=UPI001BD27646|nr:hypothetical protein [Tepidanaerobacter syntrophicus]
MNYLNFIDLAGNMYATLPIEEVPAFSVQKSLGAYDVISQLELPNTINAKVGYKVRFNNEDFIIRKIATKDNKIFTYELESVYSELVNTYKHVDADEVDLRYVCNYVLEGTQFSLGTLDDEWNPMLYGFQADDNALRILNMLSGINRTYLVFEDGKVNFLKRANNRRYDIAINDTHNFKIEEIATDSYGMYTDIIVLDSEKTEQYRVTNYDYYINQGVPSGSLSQFKKEYVIEAEKDEYVPFLSACADELANLISSPAKSYRGTLLNEIEVYPGDIITGFLNGETNEYVIYAVEINYKERKATLQLESPKTDLSDAIIKTTESVKYLVPTVDLSEYVKLNEDYSGTIIDEEKGLVMTGENNELAIDKYGINPKFVKNFPNKCWNSGFENYDPVTNIPFYWEGCTVSGEAAWEGSVSAEVQPDEVMKQKAIGWEGYIYPEWWDFKTTRVSFRYKFGGFRVGVFRSDTNILIPIIYSYQTEETIIDENGEEQIITVEHTEEQDYIDFPYVGNWDEGLANFSFESSGIPYGVGLYLVIQNMSSLNSLFIDAVQVEPDFTGKWPSIYSEGPKSNPGSSVSIEYKRVPYQKDTSILFTKRYPYPPIVTAGLDYDFLSGGVHSLPSYDITPHIECLIQQESGINWYYGARVVWTGNISSINHAYTTIIAVCRG